MCASAERNNLEIKDPEERTSNQNNPSANQEMQDQTTLVQQGYLY